MIPLLPLEIIERINSFLPNSGRIKCLQTCKAWYAHLYRCLVRSNEFIHRRQFVQFLSVIVKHSAVIGHYVQAIYLKGHVGITYEEFELLGTHCPNIETLQFRDWRHYKPPVLSRFPRLRQIPKIQDFFKGQNALTEARGSLTHLELPERLIRTLVVRGCLMPFLSLGTNLTHLTLEGYYNPTTRSGQLEFDYKKWSMLHHICKHLQYIKMTSVTLTTTDTQVTEMMGHNFDRPTTPTSALCIESGMKELILRHLNIDHPVWITYLSRKYPDLTRLDLIFDLGAFVSYDETTHKLDYEQCYTAFLDLARTLDKLKILNLEGLKRTHFPGEDFFYMLSSKNVDLSQITALYAIDLLSQYGSSNNKVLDAIVMSQQSSLTHLEVDMWIRSYDHISEVARTLSYCYNLVDLSLSSSDFELFNYNPIPIDLILDGCARLTKLQLVRTALIVDDKHFAATLHTHPLKRLVIGVARVSDPVFRYLTQRCPHITHLEVITSFWMPRELEMEICMPNNSFDYVRISDMNKLKMPRLEGDLGSGTSVNIFSVTQLDRIEAQRLRYQRREGSIPDTRCLTQWYHLYESDEGRIYFPPSKVRKLHREEVTILKRVILSCKLLDWFPNSRDRMGSQGFVMDRYVPKKNWIEDVKYGYVGLTCKSVKTIKYNFNTISYQKNR